MDLVDAISIIKGGVFKLGLMLVVAVVFILAVAACSTDDEVVDLPLADIARSPETSMVIPVGEPVVIGVSSALTGPAAPRGQEYRDAVVVAVEQWKTQNGALIGGHEISVVSEDDGCTEADVTRLAAERLLKRPGLVGVMGPQCSAGAVRTQGIYADAGIVMISGSATSTKLAEQQLGDGFFFRTAYRNDAQGVLIGVYFSDPDFLGARNVYIVHDNETYGDDLAFRAQPILLEAGLQVTMVSVDRGTVDFSELAAEIAGANPDAMFFAGFNPEAILLLRQLRDAGWNGAYASGDAVCGAANCEFLAALGELAEGAAFSGCSPPLDTAFVKEFIEVHGSEPTAAFVAQYSDAATILLTAVKSVAQDEGGSLVIDPIVLRDAVSAATLPGGRSGNVAFNSVGDRASSPVLQNLEQFAQELGLLPCRIENGAIAYFN